MASITNLGSVSGLPLEKILSDLQAAEAQEALDLHRPRLQLQDPHRRLRAAAKRAGSPAEVGWRAGQDRDDGCHQGSVTGGTALTATVAAEGAVA
ncbi:hypothetical protein VS28_18665, partial [Vibrio cholerae O1 biovar El Tor]